MVNNQAIVSVIAKISAINNAPCKKTLQKIIFLIQAKKINLGCDYGIHFFGPYSSDLDFAVRELCDQGVLSIEYTSLEHRIHIADSSDFTSYDNERVNAIVNEFAKETPSELELLATALYVYLSNNDITKVKSGVVKIKGDKYSEHRIDLAIERLKKTGYIVS